ncbi:protein ELFN1 [Meleagris gallopavo]|uniref:Extracellular leucine rich repeat and fibronectin type III domain containing 1 n=1 Tax=Meleagris gallopavo TaxID=9103 RepID=G1NR92_MELGA|nr:protein ELFN1 [Meleagris gallopavo]XP_010717945.1 protein ELFN1 [Meleagris gallopavo]XP_010717946.1 protein ELFN1 [Meleagris gallopavo]
MPPFQMAGRRWAATSAFCMCVVAVSLLHTGEVRADCWLIEGDKGFVWLAICSQNQPPYESIPQQINSTIVDLRLNDNKIKSVQYASLSRFGNLTYLNLTKNEISYIEDGAFSGQFNLQVLQLGYNRLRNLTEGILRGLGKLEYLYLQANLIESVTPNAFWECPNIVNIDLSMNRIQRLDSNTFRGLNKLSVCELYSNPFYCSCELLGFLQWLEAFTNMTRTYDRMQCDSPPDYTGYYLLGQGRTGYRNALSMLSSLCTGGSYTVIPRFIPPRYQVTTVPSESPCSEEECSSGDGTTPQFSLFTPIGETEVRPNIQVKHLNHNSAVLTVQIPYPFSKMYILSQFENGFSSMITKLRKKEENITVSNLVAQRDYTYCVVSVHQYSKYNHTCVTITPTRPNRKEPVPTPSTATHYIMTILGCLFGMVIVLGVVYYCLRKRRQQEEKHKKAASGMKKTIIELKYGPEMETTSITQLSQGQMLGGETVTRIPYLPSAGEVEQYKLIDSSETPKATKGNYMEVRTGEQSERRDCELSLAPDTQSSVAEISTIAKEVDKVNQIINNCIDALKSESTSFQGVKSGAVSTVEPQLVLLSEQIPSKHGFLSPVYKESYNHPLQRHHSMEAAPKRSSTSSSGSIRSPRSYRSEGSGHKSEAKYIEKTSPTTDTILTVTPAAAILRAEAEKIRQYSEHRHSYPGSHQGEQHDSMAGRKPSILEPLTRPRPRDLAYSQLSPQYHNLSYTSSPEYTCKPSHSIWERFKLNRKRHKEEEEYMAAGHALRKKVQFAKDEDLHDILDYWKGVSAQQKS